MGRILSWTNETVLYASLPCPLAGDSFPKTGATRRGCPLKMAPDLVRLGALYNESRHVNVTNSPNSLGKPK